MGQQLSSNIQTEQATSQSVPKQYDPSKIQTITELGSGNFGEVKLLYHEDIQQQYVVGKMFPVCGDQKMKEKIFKDAEEEAKILCSQNHRNIVHCFGIAKTDEYFGIISEYVPYGNLESFLTAENEDGFLPWSIRKKFFMELASAIDYLHYHDSRKPYVHGDLKSQNVLLGHNLTIKLADFGAATIAKVTGSSSPRITDNRKQYTPYYTAPEFLKNPNQERRRSMDVYSYGMIGYEIITRKAVYSGCFNMNLVIFLIQTEGLKPDISHIDETATTLEENSSDSIIFHELEEVVYDCWKTNPGNRPKISEVKKRLEQLQQNQIRNITARQQEEQDAQLLIARMQLTTQLPAVAERPTAMHVIQDYITKPKFWISLLAIGIAAFVTVKGIQIMWSSAPSIKSLMLEGRVNDNILRGVDLLLPNGGKIKLLNLPRVMKLNDTVYTITEQIEK